MHVSDMGKLPSRGGSIFSEILALNHMNTTAEYFFWYWGGNSDFFKRVDFRQWRDTNENKETIYTFTEWPYFPIHLIDYNEPPTHNTRKLVFKDGSYLPLSNIHDPCYFTQCYSEQNSIKWIALYLSDYWVDNS